MQHRKRCTAISQAEQAKQLAKIKGRTDDRMDICTMLFSPSMSGSPCYTGFLSVYLHTENLDSLFCTFKETPGKDTPVIS